MADKDKASDRVFNSRLRALDSLRISVEALSKECNRLEKKIEEDGLASYYSINSDVLRWARRVHSACYELSILRECQVYIDGDCGRIEELGKAHGKEEKEDQNSQTQKLASSACSSAAWGSDEGSQESSKQAGLSRSSSAVSWRLEALVLIALGMGLGYLLLGTP